MSVDAGPSSSDPPAAPRSGRIAGFARMLGRKVDPGRAKAPPSLVGRLIGLAVVWSLLVMLGAGLALTAFFRNATLSRFDKSLYDITEGLYAGTTVQNGEVVGPLFTDNQALRVYSGRYWEIAEVGPSGALHVLVPSRSLWDSELKGPPAGSVGFKPGDHLAYNTVGPVGERLRAVVRTVALPGRSAPVVFLAAENRGPIDADSRSFAVTTALALAVLGAGLVAGVVIQVRVGLLPLFRLRRNVSDVRKGRSERLDENYPEELAPLAGELNALLAHNQEVVERQRTHVGNLAHALKTPLSVLLTEVERREDPLAELVKRQAQIMRGQVDHHLRRARAAARAQGQGERTPVAPVVEELSRTLERIFQDKRLMIDWDVDETLAFHGERQDLLEIIGNIMENAAKWGRRMVSVRVEADGPSRLRVTVEDDGPGLPAERRGEVLQRGARLDESAPGSGLGLSIVEELAKAYGGSIELAQASLGGLRVDIVLPCVEA
ncbi:MAG TPA: ATP-binding protein [Caulobacteraceae bacterium]|nr:ATP-binding protein [Caulobacteraceae bacterium]